MRLRRWLLMSLGIVLGGVGLLALAAAAVWWWLHPAFDTTRDVVYTRSKGHDLPFHVLRPKHPNGLGVLVLVSGQWKSNPKGIEPMIIAPVLRKGYTVFAVTHGSQPEFTVMEIFADLTRAVRFIRHHARDYGIDPGRLGVTGGSSGGHLSLMLATRGEAGHADSPDPVERQSSAIQAVACFYPVTDLLNLGHSTENPGDGGPPIHFVKAFGPDSTNLNVWKGIGRDMSPIYHITSNLPPILIVHGGADTLVPVEQSEWFVNRAKEVGRPVVLEVRPGKQHGWLLMPLDVARFARWFDQHLRAEGR